MLQLDQRRLAGRHGSKLPRHKFSVATKLCRYLCCHGLKGSDPELAHQLPEALAHDLSGWGQHGDITRQVLSLVLLRHDEEPPQLAEQFATVETWTDEVVTGIHTVRAQGDGALAQILDLALFGDVVALDLAERYGIDPGPTPAIAASPAVAVD